MRQRDFRWRISGSFRLLFGESTFDILPDLVLPRAYVG